MKAIPSSVVVGPYTYAVIVDEAAVHRASYEAGSNLAGNSDHERQEIALLPDLGPDAEAELLAHEVIHAMLEQAPLGLTKDEVERVTHALGFLLVDTLRRNPELVAFLIQEPTGPTRTGARSRHGRPNGRSRTRPEGR